MTLTLYSSFASPPCRAVILTAKLLGLDLKIVEVAVLKGETKTPEFIKMNPQHAVPTLDDDGFFLGESRAIMEYLIDKYGETNSLTPKDVKERTLVSSRLYFDATSLYAKLLFTIIVPMVAGTSFGDVSTIAESLDILDALIGEKGIYLVNDRLTIADISTAVTISTLEAVEQDISDYRNIVRWYANIKKVVPGFQEVNEKADAFIGQLYRTKLAKSKFS